MKGKVSVVIPSFNRFVYLQNAVRSVLGQSYPRVEVVIVNDCSTQNEYYTFDFKSFGPNVYIVHLPRNSRDLYGRVCGGGHARNIGMMLCSGEYIAFLDDDDCFLPTKIEKQINAMTETGCFMSCTEGLIGRGPYQSSEAYDVFHYRGHYWDTLQKIFGDHDKTDLLEKMYEDDKTIWGYDAIHVHNCTIGGSSIIIKSELVKKAGFFPLMPYGEDWEYWKKLIMHTDCVFLREPLVYIDTNHGDGQHYDLNNC